MKARVICGSVMILMIGIQSALATSAPDNMDTKSDLLIRERRDEELHYPDDIYDSGEQDRWPTLEELSNSISKRRLSAKRGRVVGGPASLEEAKKGYITRRQNLENSLYDLLSRPRPAPERRAFDNLKDLYMDDVSKRLRLPRSPEEAILEQSKDQPVSEKHAQKHAQNQSVADLSE